MQRKSRFQISLRSDLICNVQCSPSNESVRPHNLNIPKPTAEGEGRMKVGRLAGMTCTATHLELPLTCKTKTSKTLRENINSYPYSQVCSRDSPVEHRGGADPSERFSDGGEDEVEEEEEGGEGEGMTEEERRKNGGGGGGGAEGEWR
eukprot:9762-Hanusia_phi.AAC.1